jgi:CoA-transferase family III
VRKAFDQAWAALGGGPVAPLTIMDAPILPAALPVADLALATVAACACAAAELAGGRRTQVHVDAARVATAFTSERHLRRNGQAFASFAPESGFFRAADGWVRTHANYPHHRERLHRVLGSDIQAAIARRSAREVEEDVLAAGGLAFAVRTAGVWAASAAGQAVAKLPLIAHTSAPPAVRRKQRTDFASDKPATGYRVLDLTRVIAGPVATRALAYVGADVLRIDPPGLPELEGQMLDTGIGKRSTVLDLAADRAAFEELLAQADVVVTGYRPGALDRFGLAPEALLERRPGLVVARLSAWGPAGPWGGRRGFDSLVQAATGIALIEGTVDSPGVLPAQALDHGTGYLLAAAVLRALAVRETTGAGHVAELALARTGKWLTDLPPREHLAGREPEPTLTTMGDLTVAQPAFTLPAL